MLFSVFFKLAISYIITKGIKQKHKPLLRLKKKSLQCFAIKNKLEFILVIIIKWTSLMIFFSKIEHD